MPNEHQDDSYIMFFGTQSRIRLKGSKSPNHTHVVMGQRGWLLFNSLESLWAWTALREFNHIWMRIAHHRAAVFVVWTGYDLSQSNWKCEIAERREIDTSCVTDIRIPYIIQMFVLFMVCGFDVCGARKANEVVRASTCKPNTHPPNSQLVRNQPANEFLIPFKPIKRRIDKIIFLSEYEMLRRTNSKNESPVVHGITIGKVKKTEMTWLWEREYVEKWSQNR